MKQDIEAGRAVFFTDAKGSLGNAKVFRKMAQDAGREKDLLFFSITNPELSNTYNPFQLGNGTQLKDKIIGTIEWSEPHYKRSCELGLLILFNELIEYKYRITLQEVYKCLNNPSESLPKFCEFYSQNKKNIITLASEIGLLLNTPFGFLFDTVTPEINLLDVYKSKKLVYFCLDTQTYQSTAMRLGKLITQDLSTLSGIVESTFNEADKSPFCVWIDEFQAFGTQAFINVLSRSRSSKFLVSIAHQSIGDLKAVDPTFCQQVIDTTGIKIFLRLHDSESIQVFCDSLGTKKVIELTRQVHYEGDRPKNIMGSEKVVDEYKIHPNDIRELETGQAVYKCGKKWGLLQMSGYFENVEGIELKKQEKINETIMND